ncbi:hypothetical protein [Thalassotalea maritima]|uniref:hypothetical protein n=1 Tax=Thalassotalea maritima TaxID=3242416 RepID=UPI003528DBAB
MLDDERIKLANTKAKGKRPYFLEDKQTEQVLSIAMSLAMELNVVRQRTATLECLLIEKGVLSQGEVDGFIAERDEAEKRSIDTQQYLARILRIVSQEEQEMQNNDDDISTIQQKLMRRT